MCRWLPGIDHSRYRHLDPPNRSEDTVDVQPHGGRHRAGGSRNLSFVPPITPDRTTERTVAECEWNGAAVAVSCSRFIVQRNPPCSIPPGIVSNVRTKCENPCSSSSCLPPRHRSLLNLGLSISRVATDVSKRLVVIPTCWPFRRFLISTIAQKINVWRRLRRSIWWAGFCEMDDY